MTTSLRSTALRAAMSLALFAGTYNLAFAQKAFDASNIKGSYVFEESGTIGTSRIISLGLLKIDGNGNVSGTATLRGERGEPITATVTGGYTIAADGTGTMNLNFSSPLPATIDPDSGDSVSHTDLRAASYNLVITSSGNVRALRTDGGEMVTASILKQ